MDYYSSASFIYCFFLRIFLQSEKDLVYAELMLKPSADSDNPNKNATEYAEIVYVSTPADAEGSQKAQSKTN